MKTLSILIACTLALLSSCDRQSQARVVPDYTGPLVLMNYGNHDEHLYFCVYDPDKVKAALSQAGFQAVELTKATDLAEEALKTHFPDFTDYTLDASVKIDLKPGFIYQVYFSRTIRQKWSYKEDSTEYLIFHIYPDGEIELPVKHES